MKGEISVIYQIRKRLERAKEHVKADPWYVSTNVYIADVGELLEDVDRLTAERAELCELLTLAIDDIPKKCAFCVDNHSGCSWKFNDDGTCPNFLWRCDALLQKWRGVGKEKNDE